MTGGEQASSAEFSNVDFLAQTSSNFCLVFGRFFFVTGQKGSYPLDIHK